MQQAKHAEQMVNRFREMVEDAGDSLSVNHYNELKLIIEAGLDKSRRDRAIDLILKELVRLKNRPVGARELKRAKQQLTGPLARRGFGFHGLRVRRARSRQK